MSSVISAVAEPALEKSAPPSIVVRGARRRWWLRRGAKRRGFWYEDAMGRRITNEAELERIRLLAIPPAWVDVRISPGARSRLQAIGIDTKDRVQYLYHAQYSARQQRKKYEKIVRFGDHLSLLRRRTNEDIAGRGLSRERVLAVVVRLINDLYFRVGSELSVERYRTYGITTLRNRHLEIKRGGRLIFSFVGKHQVRHRRIIVDEDLATLMSEIKAIGGSKLFNYIGEDGKARPVKARDVNDYIKAATAQEFSAKDFRTWGGTLHAAVELAEMGKAEDEKEAKRNLGRAVKRVAERLGNTPTVCRSCYIHPLVFDGYLKGITLEEFRRKVERSIRRIQPEYELEEVALLKLLKNDNKAVTS
ncbi:MAG: DNA topoisomerase IB [Acidobacteria bacterium]|nr:DNA topoisomerase IB [Acidobacteriota bacterium]